jgi:hypothetical protein
MDVAATLLERREDHSGGSPPKGPPWRILTQLPAEQRDALARRPARTGLDAAKEPAGTTPRPPTPTAIACSRRPAPSRGMATAARRGPTSSDALAGVLTGTPACAPADEGPGGLRWFWGLDQPEGSVRPTATPCVRSRAPLLDAVTSQPDATARSWRTVLGARRGSRSSRRAAPGLPESQRRGCRRVALGRGSGANTKGPPARAALAARGQLAGGKLVPKGCSHTSRGSSCPPAFTSHRERPASDPRASSATRNRRQRAGPPPGSATPAASAPSTHRQPRPCRGTPRPPFCCRRDARPAPPGAHGLWPGKCA